LRPPMKQGRSDCPFNIISTNMIIFSAFSYKA